MKNCMRNFQRSTRNAIGISISLLMSSAASTQTIEWVRQFGTSGSDGGQAVTIDASGNVYTAGLVENVLPGQTSAGSYDAFVCKYDASGNLLWTRQFGTGNVDVAYSISHDATGIYVGGNFGSNAFLRKYDSAGNELWTRQFALFYYFNAVFDIVSDPSGVYVAGRTMGDLLGVDCCTREWDSYVRKYDTDGNELWTRQFGTSTYDQATSVTTDATGVYVAGGTGDYSAQSNTGDINAYLRKYDADGNEIWSFQFGTSAHDQITDIIANNSGVYVGGYTGGALPGQTSSGSTDAFIRKYNTDGEEIWTRQFGTAADDGISSLGSEGVKLFVGGSTSGVLPGQTNAGGSDVFIRTYDTSGSELSTHQFGTSSNDGLAAIANAGAIIYAVGSTLGVFSGQTSSGGGDAFIVKFGPSNQPPQVATEQLSTLVDEGSIATNTGTVSDPDGDTVTLSSSIGTVTNNGNGTWSWSYQTTDGPAQSQTVTITADDGNGGVAQMSFALQVNNVAPSVNVITVPINPIDIANQPVSVSATFSDPAGSNDTPYTCTIDFGDGSGPQVGTVSGMACSGSYTYASAGVFVVTVMVTDKDNDSGSGLATNFIVIYDPSAGYVTGGGWIDSTPGAYVPDPTLTGKANFGFVSKYQKGKSIPDGNTTFHFNTANFKFKSTSYEWLVIAGPKAQYKGEGTVNNNGNYGFMLFASDGQISGGGGVDKFRIKIWDKSNGDAVVYDNQMGDPDNGDATDAIEGGSITIHSGNAKAAAGSSEEGVVFIPTEYTLEQNYPNPFNPSTQITFALPEAGEVQLVIYNSSGQLVRTLVAGQKTAGLHNVVWDASDNNGTRVASGVYLYVFKASNFTAQRKLVLMK